MSDYGAVAKMLTLGLVAGTIGGMFGIGGGLIMVPALILIFGLDLKTATGTSLFAQLLPVGVLGVLEYWRRGEVQVGAGLWIALGILFGALLGAKLTGVVPGGDMKRLYGLFLVAVGIYFLFWSPSKIPGAAKGSAPIQRAPTQEEVRL
jgi:uncharacterized membrane protein YfcA